MIVRSTGVLYPPSALVLLRLSTKSDLRSSKAVCVLFSSLRWQSLTSLSPDLETICSIAVQVLEQKAFCQQDPDQDAEEEAPEDQAEYDSVLISSAGDLVAALANALGADFAQAFGTFFPLIAKYYVSFIFLRNMSISDRIFL